MATVGQESGEGINVLAKCLTREHKRIHIERSNHFYKMKQDLLLKPNYTLRDMKFLF